jgi:hypothetical protein
VKVGPRGRRRVGPKLGTVGPGSPLFFSILFSIPFSLFPSLNLNFELEFKLVSSLFSIYNVTLKVLILEIYKFPLYLYSSSFTIFIFKTQFMF